MRLRVANPLEENNWRRREAVSGGANEDGLGEGEEAGEKRKTTEQ